MQDFNFDPIDGFENSTTFVDKPLNARENVMRLLKQIRDFINNIMKSAIENKVEKVEGKGLSANDYTTAEQSKLAGIQENANNYTHPSTHPANIITEETDKKFMTDSERSKLAGIVEGATKNEIATVTGTCTVNPSADLNNPVGTTTQIVDIAFPEGYTKENCVVLAIGRKRDSWTGGYGFGTGVFNGGIAAVTGNLPISVVFSSTNNTMTLNFANTAGVALTILYKIVLMKIA